MATARRRSATCQVGASSGVPEPASLTAWASSSCCLFTTFHRLRFRFCHTAPCARLSVPVRFAERLWSFAFVVQMQVALIIRCLLNTEGKEQCLGGKGLLSLFTMVLIAACTFSHCWGISWQRRIFNVCAKSAHKSPWNRTAIQVCASGLFHVLPNWFPVNEQHSKWCVNAS